MRANVKTALIQQRGLDSLLLKSEEREMSPESIVGMGKSNKCLLNGVNTIHFGQTICFAN